MFPNFLAASFYQQLAAAAHQQLLPQPPTSNTVGQHHHQTNLAAGALSSPFLVESFFKDRRNFPGYPFPDQVSNFNKFPSHLFPGHPALASQLAMAVAASRQEESAAKEREDASVKEEQNVEDEKVDERRSQPPTPEDAGRKTVLKFGVNAILAAGRKSSVGEEAPSCSEDDAEDGKASGEEGEDVVGDDRPRHSRYQTHQVNGAEEELRRIYFGGLFFLFTVFQFFCANNYQP